MKLNNSNLTAQIAVARATQFFETVGAEGEGFSLATPGGVFHQGIIHFNPGKGDACHFMDASSSKRMVKSSPNLVIQLIHGEGNGRACNSPYLLALQLFLGSIEKSRQEPGKVSVFWVYCKLISLQYVFQEIEDQPAVDRTIVLYDMTERASLEEIPHRILPPIASPIIEAMRFVEVMSKDLRTALNVALHIS